MTLVPDNAAAVGIGAAVPVVVAGVVDGGGIARGNSSISRSATQ